MKLIRNNTFDNDIIFVDGHGGSGKSKISRLLEFYDGVEKSKEDEIFYYITRLHELKKIPDDVALTLLKIASDRILYNQMICRDINFRLSDMTSLSKYPFPLDYIKRIYEGERMEVTERIKNDKPIFQNMTQNSLISGDILFRAFGNRLKLIHINRNPINVIYRMNDIGFGDRMGHDPTDIGFTYEFRQMSIPTYAKNQEIEFLNARNIDKMIMWIYNETKSMIDSYNKLNKRYKKNVMFINFDAFSNNPNYFMEEIKKFIGRDFNRRAYRFTKKVYPEKYLMDYKMRMIDIYSIVSNKYKEMLDEVMRLYDRHL